MEKSQVNQSEKESFSVIETGGKQYKVSSGDTIAIEKLAEPLKEGATVSFDKVLLVHDGAETKIGMPYVDGAAVTAVFKSAGRGKKISVIRFKAKSRHFKKRGHRQEFVKVVVK